MCFVVDWLINVGVWLPDRGVGELVEWLNFPFVLCVGKIVLLVVYSVLFPFVVNNSVGCICYFLVVFYSLVIWLFSWLYVYFVDFIMLVLYCCLLFIYGVVAWFDCGCLLFGDWFVLWWWFSLVVIYLWVNVWLWFWFDYNVWWWLFCI